MKTGCKGKYCPEVVEKIIKCIRAGNYNRIACHTVGISEETFYTWIKTKPDFSEAIKEAQAEATARNVALIQKAAISQWQAAAWWLERKHYKEWGRKDRNEIVGKDGEKLEYVFKVEKIENNSNDTS